MHLVETMAYAGEKPWHGLGNKLAPRQSIDTWKQQAGMDWEIEASEVRYISGNNHVGVINAFPEQKVLYRSDTKAPLAVVSKRFQVVQPGEILEFYRDLTACNGFELETAGVLREGRKFWALARTGQNSTHMVMVSKDNNTIFTANIGSDSITIIERASGPAGWSETVVPVGKGPEGFDLSPDGRQLLAVEYLSIIEQRLWLVDATTGDKKRLAPAENDTTKVVLAGAQFSADGRGIYLATDRDSEFQRLAHLDLATGQLKILTPDIPWDVEDFRLSWDGKRIALITNEEGWSVLRILDTATGKVNATVPVGVSRFALSWAKLASENTQPMNKSVVWFNT